METDRRDELGENPIDKDKITEHPDSLEYAHHRGSAVVKPEDRGKIKSRALSAMEQQTDQQMMQIQEQIQLLAKQAKLLQSRVDISHKIYGAEMRFEPLVGHEYYLYQKQDATYLLSILGPEDWGKRLLHEPVARVYLMADHTWDVKEFYSSEL